MNRDATNSKIKSPRITNGVDAVNLDPPAKLATVSNRMIETASFMMPSPKTSENILGCFSYLRIETAAITSEEHISAQKSMISSGFMVKEVVSPV